jgi:hypothetical protein
MGYMRPHNRHDRYHNLYFVGAGTHPGSGVPTVLTSARLVCERIFEGVRLPKAAPVSKPEIACVSQAKISNTHAERVNL